MMFPPKPLWKIIREEVPISASSYVVKYLGTVQSNNERLTMLTVRIWCGLT